MLVEDEREWEESGREKCAGHFHSKVPILWSVAEIVLGQTEGFCADGEFRLQLHRFRNAGVTKNRSRESPFWTFFKKSSCVVGRHARENERGQMRDVYARRRMQAPANIDGHKVVVSFPAHPPLSFEGGATEMVRNPCFLWLVCQVLFVGVGTSRCSRMVEYQLGSSSFRTRACSSSCSWIYPAGYS